MNKILVTKLHDYNLSTVDCITYNESSAAIILHYGEDRQFVNIKKDDFQECIYGVRKKLYDFNTFTINIQKYEN